MNNIWEVVIITITPNRRRHPTLEAQSRRDDLKVAQDAVLGTQKVEWAVP